MIVVIQVLCGFTWKHTLEKNQKYIKGELWKAWQVNAGDFVIVLKRERKSERVNKLASLEATLVRNYHPPT